jgi:hypothetical protein
MPDELSNPHMVEASRARIAADRQLRVTDESQ